ncbi:hypothetical protein DSO57_1018206 [Entomophthora muscae]|uniref:Uncharacterized protein n=1 Tax=Entomophthora muscae TaxID=34485 RepID=A0ACC2S677_9FUNG|nr:hypothetical protein DSO57_1018206 [Entomophthora muscae]
MVLYNRLLDEVFDYKPICNQGGRCDDGVIFRIGADEFGRNMASALAVAHRSSPSSSTQPT